MININFDQYNYYKALITYLNGYKSTIFVSLYNYKDNKD